MGKLDEYKSKMPQIIGSTTINHEARVRLGLTCSEYVLLEHLHHAKEKHDRGNPESIYLNTGFVMNEVEALMRNLMQKGFVAIVSGVGSGIAASNTAGPEFMLSTKWNDGFADIEKEFDQFFWKIDGKVQWTGTRKKALEYYIKLRKRHSKDYLVKQRDDYFKFLDLQKILRKFDQQRLMCQVFLNPANERFAENYADYIVQLKAKYGDPETPKIKPVTTADIMQQYGKNHNQ